MFFDDGYPLYDNNTTDQDSVLRLVSLSGSTVLAEISGSNDKNSGLVGARFGWTKPEFEKEKACRILGKGSSLSDLVCGRFT